MRKKVIVLFFLILFTLNIGITANAETFVKEGVKQGFYSLKDLDLIPSSKYNIVNESNTDSMFLLVFDSQNRINQAVRLEPRVTSALINPLQINYKVIVIGNGTLSFIL